MHATVPRNADTRRRDGWVRCRKDSTTSTSRRTVSARSGSSAWRCVVPWSRASWCRSVSRGLSSAGTVGHHREAVHPALRALALKSASVAASPSASAAVLAVYGSGEERRDREERKSAARGWGVNTKWKCPVRSRVEMSGAGGADDDVTDHADGVATRIRCFARSVSFGLARRAASRSRCCAAIQSKTASRCLCSTTTPGTSCAWFV